MKPNETKWDTLFLKMVKKILLLSLILCASHLGLAQEFSSRAFHKGWLVTDKNDTIQGDIKYDMDANAVQVLIDDTKIKTFSSKDILFFEIYDSILKSYRQFYCIPFAVRTNYKVPIIFEVLYEGPMSLLAREKIVMTTDPYSNSYFGSPSVSRESLAFKYYFVNTKGKMTLYNGKKAHLYEILYENTDKVKTYIKTNKLKIGEMRDLVRITAFYNSL